MSLALVQSRSLVGLKAAPVTVEVHLANGLPAFNLVGLADVEVKEARERVRSAILNSGLSFPNNQRITVNLAPADLPKDSGRFDLPIALGILAADGQLDAGKLAAYEFAGELSLSGELRAVRGALAAALALHAPGTSGASKPGVRLVLPPQSAQEAALVPEARVISAKHLLDVVAQLLPEGQAEALGGMGSTVPGEGWQVVRAQAPQSTVTRPDLSEVRGQSAAKRALEIAAAGGHSLLMSGPPGSGKTMLAQRFAGLLPPMNTHEALESAALASLAGRFKLEDWGQRPTRSPHHSASAVALVGGGSPPRPGEISLAHHGVLFLDELPEFPRSALEALREPLETGHITISRAAQRSEFPAQFQLVAAMNPCPCGYAGASHRVCKCTPDQVARYQARLSGPLLDRIDLHVSVSALPAQELLQTNRPEETSEAVRARVLVARNLAEHRQGCSNQGLKAGMLDAHIQLDDAARSFLNHAATRLGWSGRGTHRTLKVARTLADLANSPQVLTEHVAEALQYRPAM